MVVAIRIVLSLIALSALYIYLILGCYTVGLLGVNRWHFDCVAKTIAIQFVIPLAIALAAGYLKKSKPVFWNVFVGAFFVITVWPWAVSLFEEMFH